MACQEMEMFYAYLDELEEAKRRAQPWQCEVTVIPQDGEASAPAAAAPAKPAMGAKPGFVCDEPE
jgi:hypothetical protein